MRTHLTFALILVTSIALFGCAGITTPNNMSAEQLTAMAKDKSAGVFCGEGTGPWGKVRTTTVNVDKAAVPNGTVTVTGECNVTITTSNAPLKP